MESVDNLQLDTINDDCVFEIFDRLPTNYLYTIAGTCMRFFQLAAIQYRRKYPNKFACISIDNESIVMLPDEYDVKVFGRKFLNLVIRGNGRNFRLENKLLQFILLNCSTNIQMLRLEETLLQGSQMQAMTKMLDRVETIILHKCGIIEDFYNCLLSKCHRLKRLIISSTDAVMDPPDNKWLLMKYPLLEVVQLCSVTIVSFQHEHWQTFFQQNPSIRSFACDHWYSSDISDRPIKIITKFAKNLNRLYISLRGIGHLNSTYYDLSMLCQSKNFQTLELQFTGNTGIQYLVRHAKILQTMDKLEAIHLTDMVVSKEAVAIIGSLRNLKLLHFSNATIDMDSAESVAKNLPKLKEVYSDSATNDFTPFVRNAPRLNKIELSETTFGELNLGWGAPWLHEERTKLPNACPIEIRVKSLATGDTEHSIILSGIISIKPLAQDKSVLLKVKNTFVNL